MRNVSILKRGLFFSILLLIIYILAVAVDIYLYGRVNQIVKADAAIVLGAAVWGDEPSPVFAERINHGIWLYENGYVDKIIFTGGVGAAGGLSEAFVAQQYAIANMVAPEHIFIEELSTITQENFLYATAIVEAQKMSRVIIVSDPLHMRRAMLMAKDHGLNAYSSPTPTTRYQTLRTKLPFLARETFYLIGYKIHRLL